MASSTRPPARYQFRYLLVPLLCALLGLCLLAGTASYVVLDRQRRMTLESERGASIAAISEAKIAEMLRSVIAGLQLLADSSIHVDDWATMATRAARVGGRMASASLVAPDGNVLASTDERNVDWMLTPDEFGGGWRGARFGVGKLFQGRDLYDRRPVPSGAAGDFTVLSVPRPQASGFVLGTISIRSLYATLSGLPTEMVGIGIGVYWRDGSRVHVSGEASVPASLPATVVDALREANAWIEPQEGDPWTGGTQIACRSSTANPFIVCARWPVAPLLDDLLGPTGAGLVMLSAVVALMILASLHFAHAEGRRDLERRAFHLKLARSEKRLAAAIDGSGCVVWEYDIAKERVRYFGVVSALLGSGAPVEESRDQARARFLPEDAGMLDHAVAAVGAGEMPAINTIARLAVGNRPWLRFCAHRDPTDQGTIVGTIADVTAVVEANERYRSIFRELAQPIFLLGDDGTIEEANPATEATFGLTPRALIGQPLGRLIQHADRDEAEVAFRPSTPATLLSLEAGPEQSLVGRRADGAVFPLTVSTGVWSVGSAHKVAIIIRDLSAEKEIERRLIAAREASDQAARAKSEFLSTMSHEIRTPLSGVIGMTGLLSETGLTPTQTQYVAMLQNSADHLLGLINDILDISKLEASKLELEPVAFDPALLVHRAVDMITATAREKGLTVSALIAPDVPKWVVGDVGRIRQVLLNLLGNAVKFTDRGSVEVTLARAPAGDGLTSLRFSVRDTGIGIPPERVPRLFSDFSQGDASISRRFGGTGLGLAISQKLAAMMGSTIAVESEPGAGSIFSFTLRLRVPNDNADPAAQDRLGSREIKMEAAGPPHDRVDRKLLILVAEDNPTNQVIARRMLEGMGHEVRLASSGQEAVDAARSCSFDAILMDVMMPEMDGIDASGRIRSSEGDRHVPILAVTANAFEHDRMACIEAGMDGFLGKPFTRAALQAALKSVLVERDGHPGSRRTDPDQPERLRNDDGVFNNAATPHRDASAAA
jgi:PAS domain S-box-containing protein